MLAPAAMASSKSSLIPIDKYSNPLSYKDYDLDFEEQDSPFLDDRPRSYDRSAVDSRRGKVVNIHATTQLKVLRCRGDGHESQDPDGLKFPGPGGGVEEGVWVEAALAGLDNLRRMITPVSNEDEDYDLDFEEQDSPFLDDRPRSYDRRAVEQRCSLPPPAGSSSLAYLPFLVTYSGPHLS